MKEHGVHRDVSCVFVMEYYYCSLAFYNFFKLKNLTVRWLIEKKNPP